MGRPNQRYLQRRNEQLRLDAAKQRARKERQGFLDQVMLAQASGVAAGLQQALQELHLAATPAATSTH